MSKHTWRSEASSVEFFSSTLIGVLGFELGLTGLHCNGVIP